MAKLVADKFKYDADKAYWWSFGIDRDSDIIVPGTPTLPDEHAIELANEALTRIGDLVDEAREYYLAFVDPVKSELQGASSLVSVACGFSDRVVRISINHESDVYGIWWVEFRLEPMLGFTPYSFGRTTW